MFLNLEDGVLSINPYRNPRATETTQEDLLKFLDSDECLTASIENVLELFNTTEGWMAQYTGITGSGEFANKEEAYNINGSNLQEIKSNALLNWGSEFELGDVRVIIHE